MTSCLAASETAVVVSSIDVDECFVCSLSDGSVKNLTKCLGETYENLPINDRDLQKACAAFSADGKLFAYNTNKGKYLSIWNTSDWSLIANRTLAKHATVIAFAPETIAIVVGDKKGDVYAFKGRIEDGDAVVFDDVPVRVLGHSSMVLDVCFGKDEKFIVTCDSDEKVRVSHYPNGKNILHYLMGHEAYVSGVCVLNGFILSGSGDGTLRLWNSDGGALLNKLALSAPIQNVVEFKGTAAVQLFNSNELHIIKVVQSSDEWSMKVIKTIILKDNVLNLATNGDQLWVLAGNSVHNYKIDLNDKVVQDESVEMLEVLKTLDNLVKSFVSLENTNLIIFLYKKMIEKQKRTEECVNNIIPVSPHSKRIKQS